MPRLLRFFALLFVSCYSLNALAAGYTCPTYKKYTSCASGYYMTVSGTYNGTPTTGNACTACGSGYTCAGGTANRVASTVTCSAGQYINGTTCKACEAGYKCNGQTTYTPNGGIQGRTACSGAAEYQDATSQTSCKSVGAGYYKTSDTARAACGGNAYYCTGSGTRTAVSSGYYSTGGDANTRTAQAQCGAGTYCVSGVSSTCPSGYPNSVAGSTAITACYSGSKSRAWSGTQTECSVPANCATVTCGTCSGAACSYVAYSNAAGNGDGTIKEGCSTNNAACQKPVSAVTSNAGYYVSGTTCPACGGNNYYCPGDNTRQTVVSGYYSTGGTETTRTGQSQCTGATYCSAGVKYDCPMGYTANTTNGKTAQSQCQLQTTAGYCIEANAAGTNNQTPCDAGYACPSALINYGDYGSWTNCTGNTYATGGAAACTSCLAGYTISGTAVSDHDSAADCKISCGGGTYLAVANGASCDNVGIGYYAAASTVSQGSVGVRNQCPAGLTTIGYGNGADEADDCGRVLNVGTNKIYLRSSRKTPKSLAVGINGVTYYGNLGAENMTGAPLKIMSDGITYSVYDDSMN